MNEEALNDAWALAKAEGFKGGQEDFKNLVQTNPDFFNMSYGTFKEKGFKGDESSFSQLLGIEPPKAKQEEQPQEVVQEQAMEPVDGEVPFVNNTNQTPEYLKAPETVAEEKPKVLKEDTTPFYLQAEDPYNKEKQLLVSDSQIKLQEEYDSQVIPVYQERFDEAIKAYIPLIEQKRAQIQSRLDSKEITEEEANTELTGYIQRAESASKSRAIKSKEVNAAFEKIIKPAGEELQKKITDVNRAQKVAAESRVEQYLKGVEESSKIERDELGYWESLGNTLYNEVAVNTLAAVPKMFQMAEQVVYNFTPYELEDVAIPRYNFETGETEYLTSPQVQARLIEDVDKLESKTKITKSSIEEFENGNYGGGLLIGAVGGATNLLGSMARSYLTRGGSMFAETSEPIWRASVKQTAERTGKTVEEVLAENLEDEFTAVTVGMISGILEKYGLDKVTKLLPKKGIISDIIKKEFKPSIPKLSKVIGTSLTETGTEYIQSGLETAATNMVEGGKSLTSAEGIKMFKDELLKYSTSKEAAEVVVSTALGTLLFGAGSAGINSVLNRTFNDAKVPKDLTGKEIESLISEGLNVKRDLLKAKTAGLISEEVFNKATYTLNEVNRVDNSLLADTKNRTEVVALAIKRDALKRVSETVDEGQKVFINDQIKELNTQIAELSVKEEPVKETVVEEQAPQEDAKKVEQEITPQILEEGKKETTDLKSGTITSSKPVKIFKGLGGKVDLNGARINAHEGAEGVFTAVDEDLANEYAKDKGMSETILPAGTTFEVVEVDGTGMTPGQYRAAEVKAINDSKADVVKLITVDGKIKAGTKKQEQYVIKNQNLIENAVQEQTAGKVSVQPEAQVGEEMAQGTPQAEAEVTAQEGQEKVESTDSVQQAKDNLSAAWKTWQEQQKNLGIAFNPQSKNKQDMALIRALLDYLKAVGARTVKDVIDSANQFTNSQINLDNKGAEYLLRASRNEFIRDRIEKGIKDGDSFTTIKNELESKGYEADEITKRYNAGLKESVPVTSQSLQESLDNFRDARNETGKNKQSLKDKIVSSAYKFIERTLDPRIDAKRILKSLGMQNALDKMQLLYGNSGAVKFRFTEAYDKIYKGLSSEDTLTLDYIIQHMRFISIDENRINLIDPPKIDHPDYKTGKQAKKLLDALNQKIGDTKYFALKDKADMYFEEFRKNLDMMENSGLITKELRDSLYEINYQPRKFLEYLMNDGKSNAQQQSNTGQNKDLIGKLGLGDDGKLFSDSQWLLSTAMMQVENAVKLNNFKAKIAESLTQAKDKYKQLVAKANKTKADKRFIADYKNSEDYFSQTDKKGFTALEYKEDGKTKKIFVREDIYKQLLNINDGPLGGNRLATVLDIIATLTGVKLLKLLATGINVGFVLGNFPNDFGFAITFEPAYSRFLPKAVIQLSGDVKRAVGSILRKDQTFRDFVENGGMVDFMHQMGALEEKGALSNVINKGIDFLWDSKLFKERQKKITDGVTKLNMLSELGIRVAVYSRVLKGEMDKIEKQTFSTQADKQKAIQEAKEHAAARARRLIDFSQGGDIIKTADKVVPYLNAASQGGYAAAQGFLNNPGRTMGIMLQSMVILGGTAVGAGLGMIAMFGGDDEDEEKTVGEIFIETIDGISDYNKRKYICIPTGQKDDKGNYTYIKIKKTQNLTPLFLISEYHTNNLIRYLIGQELEPPSVLKTQLYDAVGDDIDPTGFMNPNQYKDGAFQGIANVVGNKSPLAAAAIVMGTGYDPYRKQSVDPPKGSFGDPNVEEFYKSLAEITGDKPERLQAATEKFITNPRTNPFIGPVYAFANLSAGDKDLKDLVVDPLNGFADGFKGRVLGSASEYPKIQRIEEKAKVLKEEIDKVDEKIHIKTSEAVNNFMNGDITKTELQNEASKIIKEYEIKDVKSYLEKINDRANNKKLPQIYFNIKYSDTSKNTPEVQALKIVEYFGSDILQDQETFIEVYDNLKKVGLDMKGDIYDEVLKLTNPEDYKKYIEDKNKPLKKSTTLTYGLNSKPLG